MPWFKLDDSFHAHPKVEAAGNAAVGLWVRCGSYSAHYLTDGHITHQVARRLGRPVEIDRLLESGLWVLNGAGYWMPDYLEYNPSAKQVRADRLKARERMARRRRSDDGQYD
jgi:hypothetical protein